MPSWQDEFNYNTFNDLVENTLGNDGNVDAGALQGQLKSYQKMWQRLVDDRDEWQAASMARTNVIKRIMEETGYPLDKVKAAVKEEYQKSMLEIKTNK